MIEGWVGEGEEENKTVNKNSHTHSKNNQKCHQHPFYSKNKKIVKKQNIKIKRVIIRVSNSPPKFFYLNA
jgi:hypothetical protein